MVQKCFLLLKSSEKLFLNFSLDSLIKIMELQKLLNLLKEANYSKLVTRKWNIANDLSNANYDGGDETICNTKVLKSNFCNCNDACILVRGDIANIGYQSTQAAFKIVHHLLNVSQKLMEQ